MQEPSKVDLNNVPQDRVDQFLEWSKINDVNSGREKPRAKKPPKKVQNEETMDGVFIRENESEENDVKNSLGKNMADLQTLIG